MWARTIVLQSLVARSRMFKVPVDVPHATLEASSDNAMLVTTPSLAAYSVYYAKFRGQILSN